jgi:hypothetical protein
MIATQTPPERTDTTGDRKLTVRVAKATAAALAVGAVAFGIWQVRSVLAVTFTSAVATLIDVLVLGHEPPTEQPRRSLRLRSSG